MSEQRTELTRQDRPRLLRNYVAPILMEEMRQVLALSPRFGEEISSFRPHTEAFQAKPEELEADIETERIAFFGFLIVQFAGGEFLKAYRASRLDKNKPIYQNTDIPEDTTYNDTVGQLIREGITTQVNIMSLLAYEAILRQEKSLQMHYSRRVGVIIGSKQIRQIIFQMASTANGFIRNSESSHWPDLRLSALPEHSQVNFRAEMPVSIPFTTGIYPDIAINPELMRALKCYFSHINDTCLADKPIEGSPAEGMSSGCPMRHVITDAITPLQEKLTTVIDSIPWQLLDQLERSTYDDNLFNELTGSSAKVPSI